MCVEYVRLLRVSGDVCLCVSDDGIINIRFVSVPIREVASIWQFVLF